MRRDKDRVRLRAVELVASGEPGVTRRLAHEIGLSRQRANQVLRALVAEGVIRAAGQTRARSYTLVTTHEVYRSFERAGLREDVVWREVFSPAVADLAQNVRDIWNYGVTEMVNNAIDHSGAESVWVGLRRNALFTDGWVIDTGVGIFLKIQKALGLYDPRESILELAKGKLTTDPANHTGEGVFFTSKIFDEFVIRAGGLTFVHDEDPFDVLAEAPTSLEGTMVLMRLRNDSPRVTKDVFDEFAAPDEFTFSKTVVPVRLAQYEGETLVSRSQAKRLSMRFERFRHVVLDFKDVTEVGQAFADELFRVFALAHPAVLLAPINMSPGVERMVERVRAGAGAVGDDAGKT